MNDMTFKEVSTIEENMPTYIDWARTNPAEAEQLAYDATRLISVTTEKFQETQNLPYIKRLVRKFTGKLADQHQSTTESLIELQKTSWKFLGFLQKEQLLQAQSLLIVKNNLTTLAVEQEITQKQVERMAKRVYERFLEVEDRMKDLEVQQNIHSWLLTLSTYDYDERYPENLRLLKIVQDFIKLKNSDWNVQELKYLQKAIKDVDLDWKKKVSLTEFIHGLIDEIEDHSFKTFEGLLPASGFGIESQFIKENISVPSYKALYEIANSYEHSEATISALSEIMKISKKDALKQVMTVFIRDQGICLDTPIPIRDLAIELMGCTGLAISLAPTGNEKEVALTIDTSEPEEEKDDKKLKELSDISAVKVVDPDLDGKGKFIEVFVSGDKIYAISKSKSYQYLFESNNGSYWELSRNLCSVKIDFEDMFLRLGLLDTCRFYDSSHFGPKGSLSFARGNGVFYTCTENGDIYKSINGFDWKKLKSPVRRGLSSIACSGNKVVAVGLDKGEFVYSLDGSSFIKGSFGSIKEKVNSVCGFGDGFIAVGDNGVVIKSTDAVSWETIESNHKSDFLKVCSKNNLVIGLTRLGEIVLFRSMVFS